MHRSKHTHPSDFVDKLTVYRVEPVDEIEPDETEDLLERERERGRRALMETQRRFAFLMDRFAIFVTEAENPRLAAWQASLAVGLPCCEGMNYETIAKKCGVGLLSLGKGRAAVSKGAKYFCEANSLKPSPYMKRAEASKSYKQARHGTIDDEAT
jgi:hypothetical protein